MDYDGSVGRLRALASPAVEVAEPDNDQDDGGPHPGAERGKVGAHAAGEPLQPQVQTPDVGRRYILPRDVLKLQQVGMMEMEIREVAQHTSHVSDVAGRQQGQWVPVPAVVNHLAGQSHPVVRSGQMVEKKPLADWWDLDLLRALLQMDLMMTAIPAMHVGSTGLGAVDQVLTLPDLIDLFLEGNNPEIAKAADQFESLHIQGPEAGVVEPPGHYSK